VGDDGLDRALGEGALSRFKLQFEAEWIDGRPSNRELAFGFAFQPTHGAQHRCSMLK
jgi:hypothetical protein